MSQTKVKSGLISDQSITASKLDVTGNGNSGELLASAGDGSFVWTSGIATEAYTDNAISNIIDGAPGALDTLNELAAALGDDANFASTVTTALGTKVDGTGTANYISKWSDSNTLGNSVIYDDGTNVGIGTSNPTERLQVYEGGLSSYKTYTSTNAGAILTSYQSQGNPYTKTTDLAAGSDGTVPSEIRLLTKSSGSSAITERMRITSTGNVGIGTTTPTEALEVAGSVILDSDNARLKIKGGVAGTNSGIDWTFNSDSTQYAKIQLDYDTRTTTGLLIDSGYPMTLDYSSGAFNIRKNGTGELTVLNGNVGIGTSSPASLLSLESTSPDILLKSTDINSTATNDIYVQFATTTGGNASGGKISFEKSGTFDSTFTSTRLTDITFHTVLNGSQAERMRLESDGDLHVDGDVIAYSTTISDERLKDNIVTIDNALDKVCELRGVEYDWNASSRSGQHDMGVIAQEVEKVFPFIVREKEMPLVDGNTYKTVDYEKLVGVLIEAVKELKQEIEILKSK